MLVCSATVQFFFPGDGSSLRSPAIPLYIIHITFGMLRVMKMKEVKKKSNNLLIIYFGSVLQKHQQAAFFSGVLANLIRHCICKLIYLFQCKININTCWLMFIMVGFSTIIYLAVSSKSISGWHIFWPLISEVLANLNRQMKEHACFSLIEILIFIS